MHSLETTTIVRVSLFVLVPVASVVALFAYRASRAAAPSHAMCVAQADHRIALHRESELPSIAAGIASTRQSMIDTCERTWSRPYVQCLIDAPTLAAVEECAKLDRLR